MREVRVMRILWTLGASTSFSFFWKDILTVFWGLSGLTVRVGDLSKLWTWIRNVPSRLERHGDEARYGKVMKDTVGDGGRWADGGVSEMSII